MKYTELLSLNGFYVVNKKLVEYLECSDASLILSYLCYRANLWEDQKGNTDGWFYCTYEFIEKDLKIKRRRQETAIKLLKKKGLVETSNQGMPSKRHFRIGDLSVLISVQTRTDEMYEQQSTECTNNNVQNVRQYNKDNIVKISNKNKDSHKVILYEGELHSKFDLFAIFYKRYSKKIDKKNTQTKFLKLAPEKIISAIEGIENFESGKELKYICSPLVYLNGERWNDDNGLQENKPSGRKLEEW